MTELNVLQTLLVGHLWQSVTLAALLAAVLIFGRRMPGSMRYGLAGAAFIAAIVLPLAAFIPGESLIKAMLDQMDAPQAATMRPADIPAPPAEAPAQPTWAAKLAASVVGAATDDGKVPFSETDLGKSAVADGAPAWALDAGAKAVEAALQSAATPSTTPTAVVPPPAPAAKPLFTFHELTLPKLAVPDLTLPLALVWLGVALFLLVRTGRDLVAVERLVARARPAVLPDALRRRMGGVRVAISPEAPGPMAAGLLKPCIVLPESIALGSPGMAALLEHERAHIERSDMAVALLQRIVLALLWWSPALHWISRRIDEEREVACDEAAVVATGDAKAFARSLTKQAENQLWARAPRLAVGAIGPRSQVGRRIKRLIELAKGAAPAKYAGRLAFAGLALAVAVAAMITPRFTADAQRLQDKTLPFDNAFNDSRNGGPRNLADLGNLTDAQRLDVLDRLDQLAGGPKGDYSSFNGDLQSLMTDLDGELQVALAGLSPELEGELAGLSAEMASLGAEIAMLVNQELAQEMPKIMAEVRQQLAEDGITVDNWDDVQELTGFNHEALQEALQEARDEIRERLGPEMREEIRAAIEQAREELAEHRDEIRAAVEESRAGMDSAREAMSKVRAEMDAARARGDFDKLRDFDFDLDDVDQNVLEKLKDLKIEKGGKPLKIKSERGTPAERLFRAAGRGDVDVVRQLIMEDKVDVNTVLPGDGTALIAAARHGHDDVVRVLLNANADPNRGSPGDGTPLMAAVANGEEDVARLLLERGADANRAAPGDGNALIAAIQHGEEDMVRLLISRGADVNAYVEHDETPLINAAEQGDLTIVQILVDRGAKVNLAYTVDSWWGGASRKELRSPLNMAIKHGRDDVADYLRSKGAVTDPRPAN